MLCAAAYLVMCLSKLLPPLVPFPPLQYDPKDTVILIGGFLYGPLSAAAVSVAVSLIEMVSVSTTGPIGLVMNIVSTCSLVCVAAVIYRYGPKRKTLAGAVIGLVAGVAAMVAVMMLWNYIITPIYTGAPREVVAGMLIPTFLPFNLLKGGLNAAFAMLIYKPVSAALRKMRLMPEVSDSAQSGKANVGVILVSLFFVATIVLLMLVFAGAI